MSVFIVLIIALGTLAFVFYPFFQEKPNAVSPVKTKPAARRKADDEIEQMVLKVRQQKAKMCPRCGARNTVNARYCSQCAASLSKGKRNG